MPTFHDPERCHRQSIRLRGYDYRQAGGYFVTLCTFQRECLLGEIEGGAVRLNDLGKIAAACWQAIPEHFPHALLDVVVIMPNHLHGILLLSGDPGEDHITSLPRGTAVGSLSAVIQNFKAVTTRKLNQYRKTPGWQVWQRGYYEHIIRSEDEANRIREYILSNPIRWQFDRENLKRDGSAALDAYPFS